MRPNVRTATIASAIVIGMALTPSLIGRQQGATRNGTASLSGITDAIIGLPLQTFVSHAEPRPIPELTFKDSDGRTHTLSEFRGKTVLLNVWATWCSPCRREMPTLDRLQATLGSPQFQVVALSVDRTGSGTVARFFTEIGIERLGIYVDETGMFASELNLFGLPGTLLLNAQGREIGRLLGPMEWDSAKMIAFLRTRIGVASDISSGQVPVPSHGSNEDP